MFLKPSKFLSQAQSIRLTLLALGLLAAVPSSAHSAENPTVNAAEKLQVTTEMVIGSCPVDQLRNAYQNLIEDRELYNMSEAEKQMLLVCTERNTIVNDYISAVENIITKLQDLPDLNRQTQDSPNDGAERLEIVNLIPSSRTDTSVPSPVTEPEATPEADGAQATIKPEPEQATGFLTGTNGCTPRYSVIATGGNEDPLETVNLSPSSRTDTSVPSPVTEPEATPEADGAQATIKPEPEQATGFLTGTNGCTTHYSVIATGGNAERNTAMIADELSGDSYHVTVGQTLPFGIEVISIDDEVVVRDTEGEHVLPYVSDGWENNDAGGYADDEFIYLKFEAKQTEHGVNTKTAPETKVFGGY